jgi:L-alanine-DL-glutamate epimerase-like enolase superfamily enzyme
LTVIDSAEVLALEVPLQRTVYISQMPIDKRCTIVVRLKTNNGLSSAIFIGDDRTTYREVCHCIRTDVFPRIIGRPPSDLTAIWNEVFQLTVTQSHRRTIVTRALAAVDTALWDLLGRQAGMPVFRLLGAARTRLRPIVIGGYRIEGEEEPDAARTVDEIERIREAGFAGVKLKVGGFDPLIDVNRVREIRKAIGEDFMLICDANRGYTVEQAIGFAEGVKEYAVEWLEEPAPWYDQIQGMKRIRETTAIPVAAGQGESNRWGCRALVEGGAVDILNNDIANGCGVSEWMRIARYAECHGIRSAHHEDAEIAMHLMSATPGGLHPEYFLPERDPIGAHLCVDPPRPSNGWVTPPEKPGFGLELDEDFVKRYTAC